MNKYFPRQMVDSIYDITHEMLQNQGIKGLILDIDNTLVPYASKEPTVEVKDWIKELQHNGYSFCLVSNATVERVRNFNKGLSLHSVYKASKPSKWGFLRAAKLMGLQANEVVVVGDQIFTDIWGGNRSGMHTILVRPIEQNEIIVIRIKRFFEKFILYLYQKKMNN